MKRRHCQGCLDLELSPAEAFPLFTARGEERWVPGWEPVYVHPASGELELDQVWITGAGERVAWWTCCHLDRAAHAVSYVRVTPGVSFGRVSVAVEARGAGSRISVAYVLTALSPDGERQIDDFARDFDAMLEQWREWIEEAGV